MGRGVWCSGDQGEHALVDLAEGSRHLCAVVRSLAVVENLKNSCPAAARCRLRMGVCEGVPRAIVPDHLGRADYHGASINSAARYMDAAAHGGQIVCDAAMALKVISTWNRPPVSSCSSATSGGSAAAHNRPSPLGPVSGGSHQSPIQPARLDVDGQHSSAPVSPTIPMDSPVVCAGSSMPAGTAGSPPPPPTSPQQVTLELAAAPAGAGAGVVQKPSPPLLAVSHSQQPAATESPADSPSTGVSSVSVYRVGKFKFKVGAY